MAISVKADKVTITNASGEQLECVNDAKEFVVRVAGCSFELPFGEAQTLCDWMLATIDEDAASV